MANCGKYKEKNPEFLAAGIRNPSDVIGLPEILCIPSTNEFSTYEDQYSRHKIEKTLMSEKGLNKHITEIKGTIQGPYSYLNEPMGEAKKKNPLGRHYHQTARLPQDWDKNKPFGMKIKRGTTTAETLEARISPKLSWQAELGKPRRRYSRDVDPNISFGIRTPVNHRGGQMWELFNNSCDEDEDL